MKKVIFSLGMLLIAAGAVAQYPEANRRLLYSLTYEDQYTTHRDHFRGFSFSVSKPVTPILAFGAGTELSGHGYHFDNDWNLYNLKFLPVFITQQLHPAHTGWFSPFLRLSEGWTYAWYQKETLADPGKRNPVRESGLYLYSGAGSTVRLFNGWSFAAACGIKGFHNSFNELDVNPHGITGSLGFVYQPK